MSYFPLVTEQVQKNFEPYLRSAGEEEGGESSEHEQMWLEYEGMPLKWHIPVGVLYDLYRGADDALPWQITVHFKVCNRCL